MPNKTMPTTDSVAAYIATITDDARREEITQIIALFSEVTGQNPVMWGTSIVGFGSYHYKYASGHEGDAPHVALSSRRQAIVLYGLKVSENQPTVEEFSSLGKHEMGKGCMYVKKLADIDLQVLRNIVAAAYVATPANIHPQA
jgi:hypothetical protein